ncbi:hypothetical protein BDC45DRAFT_509749 [Circinella umbellata]|nr:hypothetical protein BDC45DRAFT_509749 [Circinella umbellata]
MFLGFFFLFFYLFIMDHILDFWLLLRIIILIFAYSHCSFLRTLILFFRINFFFLQITSLQSSPVSENIF